MSCDGHPLRQATSWDSNPCVIPLLSLFKSLLNFFFFTILLLFYILCFFGQEACGILPPPPGIKPTFPALEGEILTTGPPGSPLVQFYT